MEDTQKYMKIKPHEHVLKWQIKKKGKSKQSLESTSLHCTKSRAGFYNTCELSPLTEVGRRGSTGPFGPIFETSCESIIISK